ncbi:MAG: V-type ATP synthase subunit E [Candidatus Ratteibacteria bacterium]|nr:V-type ATP synthase subunit E [Candidatus Ratteibacteria bacterium]
MALKDILKRIEQQSQADIASVNKEAKEKCAAISKETEGIIRELKEKNRYAASLKAKKTKEYLLQEARIKMAQEKLKKKGEVLDSIFKESLDRLEKIADKEYMSWMGKAISNVIEPGENEIVLSQKFIRSIDTKNFLETINKKLENKSWVKLSKDTRTEEIKGGFILKKRKKEINCSFESLLEEKRNDIKLKISQILFKNS